MARRAPSDEKPFRPLDMSVLSSVMRHSPETVESPPIERTLVRATNESVPRTASSVVAPPLLRLDQEKRVLYTRQERQALDRLVNNLAVRLNAQVKVSHVMRALTTLLLHAENQMDQRATEQGSLIRPPNGDFAALQRFERAIACLLAQAIRDAGVPR